MEAGGEGVWKKRRECWKRGGYGDVGHTKENDKQILGVRRNGE